MHTALEALPTVEVEADFSLDGETGDIAEGDIVTCTARAVLHRASHQHSGALLAPCQPCSGQQALSLQLHGGLLHCGRPLSMSGFCVHLSAHRCTVSAARWARNS